MKGLHAALLLATCVALVALSTLVVFSEDPPQPEAAKSVDPEMQIVSEKLLANAPEHRFRWPTSAEITAGSASGDKVDQVKSSCVKWIHTVLSDKWIPADLAERLVALNADVGNDAVWVRYEFQGYYIQIVQTASGLALAVKPTIRKEPTPNSAGAHEKLVTDTVHLFLKEADKVLTCCMPGVTSEGGVTHGRPRWGNLPEAVYWWYGLVHWWTDGEGVALAIGKADGRITNQEQPVVIKDWF